MQMFITLTMPNGCRVDNFRICNANPNFGARDILMQEQGLLGDAVLLFLSKEKLLLPECIDCLIGTLSDCFELTFCFLQGLLGFLWGFVQLFNTWNHLD